MSKDLRANRAQVLLQAANLYKSHKIHQELMMLAKINEQGFSQLNQQIFTQSQIIAQQENDRRIKEKKEEDEKKKNKLLKQILFNVTEELEEIEKKLKFKKKNFVEIYFTLLSLNTELTKFQITPESFEDQLEKKLISNSLKKLNSYIINIKKKLKSSDLKDIDLIMDILEVNEEEEIQKLNPSIQEEKLRIERIKWLNETSVNYNRYGEMLYILVRANKSLRWFRLENQYSSIWPQITNNENDREFKFYKKFYSNLEKMIPIREHKQFFEKLGKLYRTWRDNYSLGSKSYNSKILNIFKKKKSDKEIWKEFYLKNKDILDKTKKIVIESLNISYSHVKTDLEKVKKLKKKIEEEKVKIKDVYKKHPFLKNIIKSR
jgi:hypothetical protein